MKLKLRSLESKETCRIEVPNACNLQQLKEAAIIKLFPSSSSSSSALQQQSLLLSLNKKEELSASSPDESLQSLGVTSGDLIYFTQNLYAFSSQNPNLSNPQLGKSDGISTNSHQIVELENTQKVESGKCDELNVTSVEFGGLMGAEVGEILKSSNHNNHTDKLGKTQMIESSKVDELIGSSSRTGHMMDTQLDGSLKLSDFSEEKLIDEMEVDDEFEIKGSNKLSLPSFLKKVYVKEVGDTADNGGDHKLLVIAVHAVLLESGFVGYDPVSGKRVEGFHLSEKWPSLAFGMTLNYTLPELLTSEVVETVVLRFQTLGKFVQIYGRLPKKGFGVHKVCLDEPRFLPALTYILKMSDYSSSWNMKDESNKLYPNQEIFEFWKMVKDGLSYPLLIDLCEQAGLVPPSCLMRLPTELKLKIIEALPGVNVARVECVCSELRFIASNNDLWKLKFEEEFGKLSKNAIGPQGQWKVVFSAAWEARKKRKRVHIPYQGRDRDSYRFWPSFPAQRDPNPLGVPFIIGGDYDRLPAFGLPQHPGRLPQHPGRHVFRTNCNLGFPGL